VLWVVIVSYKALSKHTSYCFLDVLAKQTCRELSLPDRLQSHMPKTQGAGRLIRSYWSIVPEVIPVTRRVKGYTRFVGKYVTGRRKRFRSHKVYIFLIRITSRVDLAMSVSRPHKVYIFLIGITSRVDLAMSVCPTIP